ncbi:hypothetical protein [Pseudomonas massiliensis]|uniref:hypothetical protein n=1 Tax=Pseudomonas massiliensis TaxID=522492 RepID=UPI00058D19E7|nr:hypothetical protein [Pseudomonas massiliensis]
MTNPAKKLTPATEDLVRLRDDIAMHALNAMVIAGGWGMTQDDGSHRKYANMREYSDAAYLFADYMLAARERRQ